jgi:endonuclease/exonuclease/phosphatase family metal-dependent hydrolase
MKRLLFIGVIGLLSGSFNPLQSKRLGDAEHNTYRIMSYNIHHGEGMDKVLDLQRIADVINNTCPDVVAVQELDSMTQRTGQVDMLRILADKTLMYPVFAPAIPFEGGKYGVGMLSKEKPLGSYQISLPGRSEPRTLLVVEFTQYYMGCTHFSLNAEERLASVELIRKEAGKLDKPFFVAGDLNARPDSPVMEAFGKDFVLFNNPAPAGKEKGVIDYIAGYKTKGTPFTALYTRIIDEPVASDHDPVVADVRIQAKKEQIFYAAPYLQNPVDEGITVMWQTRVPAYSWVEYGTDTLQLKTARTLVDGQVICNDLHNRVRIEGLQPGQTYYYRVNSREILLYQAYKKVFGETAVSPFYSFTLPSAETKDFTALIFNDIHKQEATLNGLYDLVKDVPYDFVFFNGDCIDDPATEEEALFHIAMQCGKVGASSRPVFYLRGNHEIRNAYSIGLRALFDYVGDKTYGAFSWGDTRFVMLDCGEDKPDTTQVYYGLNDFTQLRSDQVGFLQEELNSAAFKQANKRVLVNHIPLYGKHPDRYQPSFDLWGSLLAEAPFHVNFSAHTHRYEYIPKGDAGNNFPVIVGGSQRLETATVMVLQKKGNEMALRVLNGNGETVYELKL